LKLLLRSDEALETAIKLKDQNPNINIGLGSIKSLPMLEEVFEFLI
jgi:hypothetical protein